MRKRLRHFFLRGISLLLVVIFSILIANKSFYLHTHRMDDGRLIVHAHPFQKSHDQEPFKIHHHSSVLSNLLISLELLFIYALFVGLLFFKEKNYLKVFKDHHIFLFDQISDQGRAPPVK